MQTTLPILISLLLAGAGLLFTVVARGNQYRDHVMGRLHGLESRESGLTRHFHKIGLWKVLQRRAGLEPRLATGVAVLAGFVLSALVGLLMSGAVGLLLGLLAATVALLLLGYAAVVRHHTRLLAELPSFIDQLIRSLKTGNNLAGAFREGASELHGPLGTVMRQAVRYMDLGFDVGEALTEVARIQRLRELSIMALAVRVNAHYGGSAVDILQNLIALVHRRERLRRQLKALTSETRFSAIVLAAIPLLISGYMMAVNPDYILTLWDHARGRWLMLGALLWQALGMLLLWRMVRGIG